MVRSLTASSFDHELASASTPVLVDFYASWCPPCRALAPALDRLAGEFAGRVAIFKVNVDDEPALAERFGVRSVPTLAVFAGREQVLEIPGYVPPSKLHTLLDGFARASAARG